MAALDRKRPYGSITGDSSGRAYEQDNTFYTASGEPWLEPEAAPLTDGSEQPVALAKPAPKKGKAADPVPVSTDAQLDAQLGNT